MGFQGRVERDEPGCSETASPVHEAEYAAGDIVVFQPPGKTKGVNYISY